MSDKAVRSLEVTIAIDTSLSAALPLGGSNTWGEYQGNTLFGIEMPGVWTTANITFQASADGVEYQNVYDQYGTELVITAAAARFILVSPSTFAGMRYLKVRSGTTGTPVSQAAERVVKLVLGTVAR